jgi:hypothetical protein
VVDLLQNFVSFLIIIEIDNWAGFLFELHLDNYYEDMVNAEEYLVFEIKQVTKNAVYIYTMLFVVLTTIYNLAGWIIYEYDYCPNYDAQI